MILPSVLHSTQRLGFLENEFIVCFLRSKENNGFFFPTKKDHLITCLPDKQDVAELAVPTGRASMATICCLGQQLMVMIDLNPSHTCEPKSCSRSYFTTSCPMCDITASSLPVLAVLVLASRTVWTLRLPGSCLFPDLTQKKVQRFEKKQEAGYKREQNNICN